LVDYTSQEALLAYELGSTIFETESISLSFYLCIKKRLLMAVGLAIASENGQNNGKITLYVVLSCVMAAMGGVIFGYDIGIAGGVTSMEPFLKKFFHKVYLKKEDVKVSNYCVFDSQLLTSFTSSLYVAGLVTSFFASYITKAFGRKPSMVAGGAAFLAGTALGAAAFNVYMLIVGRLLLGVGVGFANQVATFSFIFLHYNKYFKY